MIEHLKETNTNWHNYHSFGMNFGAMLNFGMDPALGNGLLSIPGVRNHKEFLIKETLSKSGIYAREKNVKIGNVIEITPTLRNEEKISVFDTSIINSIGGIASGVQEIKENWEAIHKPQYHDIIVDAEPVDVVQGQKEEKTPVIAVDAEPKTPEKQGDFSFKQDEIHEIIDEIYYEDIAPYHEFERAQSPTFSRPGSPVSELDYLEIAKNFVKAVSESAVEFGAELVTPGGVENYQKFKDGKISALEYTNLVAQDMARDATAAAIGAQIGGGLGGAAGLAMAGGGSIPGAAAGSTAGAAVGVAISRTGTAISRTLNKEKHDSTVMMNENHSKSAGGKTEKVVDREAQRKVGNVGKYGELTRNIEGKGFYDGKQAHHIPSKSFMAKYGAKEKDGLSIMMTKEQHDLTRTMRKAPTSNPPRVELAKDLCDVRKIMKEDGSYTKEVNKKLLDGVDKFKTEFPEVFKKEKK